jgi:predicted Zn-dependent peptidase
VQRHFGELAPGAVSLNGGPPRPAARVVTRSKRELEQVHLCLGTPSYPQTHESRYGVYILNTILGGSMSSRLFQNVREKRGLVYSISSGVTAYSDAGILSVYAGTSLDSVDEVLRLTLDELRRLMGERLTADELRRAKDHLKGSLMLSLESTGSRMSHLARQEIYFGRHFELDEITQGIESVDAEHVQKIASEVFTGGLTVSVLGNLGKYRPRAAQLRV